MLIAPATRTLLFLFAGTLAYAAERQPVPTVCEAVVLLEPESFTPRKCIQEARRVLDRMNPECLLRRVSGATSQATLTQYLGGETAPLEPFDLVAPETSYPSYCEVTGMKDTLTSGYTFRRDRQTVDVEALSSRLLAQSSFEGRLHLVHWRARPTSVEFYFSAPLFAPGTERSLLEFLIRRLSLQDNDVTLRIARDPGFPAFPEYPQRNPLLWPEPFRPLRPEQARDNPAISCTHRGGSSQDVCSGRIAEGNSVGIPR